MAPAESFSCKNCNRSPVALASYETLYSAKSPSPLSEPVGRREARLWRASPDWARSRAPRVQNPPALTLSAAICREPRTSFARCVQAPLRTAGAHRRTHRSGRRSLLAKRIRGCERRYVLNEMALQWRRCRRATKSLRLSRAVCAGERSPQTLRIISARSQRASPRTTAFTTHVRSD